MGSAPRIGEWVAGVAAHRLRALMTATYARGPYSATLGARYWSALETPCAAVITAARATDRPDALDYCADLGAVTRRDLDGDGDLEVLVTEAADRIGARWSLDLELARTLPWRARIGVGVRNLADRAPPVIRGTFPATDDSYPLGGRTFHLRYVQSF